MISNFPKWTVSTLIPEGCSHLGKVRSSKRFLGLGIIALLQNNIFIMSKLSRLIHVKIQIEEMIQSKFIRLMLLISLK